MSGLRSFTSHPDRIRDPHDRARALASEALVGPLEPFDASWLADHLAHCPPCAAETAAWAADADLLGALRSEQPPAPRDLGARVSTALDGEVRRTSGRRRSRVAGGSRAGRDVPSWAGGALAGLTVAALVAVLVLPLGSAPGSPSPSLAPAATLLAEATPITVDAKPVSWVRRGTDGSYVIASADVDRVCPGVDATSCGTIDGTSRTLAALDVRPTSLLLPRAGSPAVVVGDGSVYAVSVATPAPLGSPGTATPAPTTPIPSPSATGEPAPPPAGSPSPSAAISPPASDPPGSTAPTTEPGAATSGPTAEPGASATVEPGTVATASPEATPTATVTPIGIPVATPKPSPTPTPEPATPLPTLSPPTPAPTASGVRAIADHVVLVGAPPAYSADGQWVAFAARPADGSHGPDVFAWRVGTPRARALTRDHASVFAGWSNGVILASAARPASSAGLAGAAPDADADPATVVARSFSIDPATGSATPIARDGVWAPVVDPTGRVVVYWSGTLGWDAAAGAWLPAAGRLLIAEWRRLADAAGDAAARPLPDAAAGPRVAGFDVRFDPAGRRLAVFVADPETPGAGRLALVLVADDGSLGDVLIDGAAALPGFSLGADRLAWSTPPGQNGEGSHVTVYAWRGDAAGRVYSIPDSGDEPVVIGR